MLEDEPPVGGVEERRQPVAPERTPRLRRHPPLRIRGDGPEHEEECGEETARTARPEAAEVDAALAAELREEEARDQEAGEDEERVDAEVAASGPSVPEVVRDDRRDRQRTKPVERGLIRHPPCCSPLHAPPWNTVPASGVDIPMPSIPVRRLNHAVLYVRDVERSVAFYRDVLGLEPVHDDWKTMGAAFVRARGLRRTTTTSVCSRSATAAPGPVRGAVGLYHLAWEVDRIEDLVEARETLLQRRARSSARATTAPRSRSTRMDPDGNEFEVMWAVPRDRLGEVAGLRRRWPRSTSTRSSPSSRVEQVRPCGNSGTKSTVNSQGCTSFGPQDARLRLTPIEGRSARARRMGGELGELAPSGTTGVGRLAS